MKRKLHFLGLLNTRPQVTAFPGTKMREKQIMVSGSEATTTGTFTKTDYGWALLDATNNCQGPYI